MKIRYSTRSPLLSVVLNILLAYVVYMLCRILYVCENWSLFAQGWHNLSLSSLLRGGLRYDGSAIAYTNTLYVLLMLLPLMGKERSWWQTMCKWFYVVVNSLAVVANLSDAVYSQYTGRRTTSTFFHEFSNESNLGTIFATELLNHWYLVLAGVALIAMLIVLYAKPRGSLETGTDIHVVRRRYLATQWPAFVLAMPLAVVAMRGGIIGTYRPVSLTDANQYVNQPNEAAIVLNTPFSVIRTIGKTSFSIPPYFDDEARLEAVYSPLHVADTADTAVVLPRRNIVVLIVESFGREYIGFYNHDLDGGTYKGYTPFVDSLLGLSLTWQETFANGRTSIDGMPAILRPYRPLSNRFISLPIPSTASADCPASLPKWATRRPSSTAPTTVRWGSRPRRALWASVPTMVATSTMPTRVSAARPTSTALGPSGTNPSCSILPPKSARCSSLSSLPSSQPRPTILSSFPTSTRTYIPKRKW